MQTTISGLGLGFRVRPLSQEVAILGEDFLRQKKKTGLGVHPLML